VGHNLLLIFGFSFARCLTSHSGKQPLIILSRTAQSKDCTAASRIHFAHVPPRRYGPRSYPLYSSNSMHSQGKTLVFPWLRQFLVLPLCCLMNFCKINKFQFILLSKIFLKLWMFLLFLLLGTILAPSCLASCQPRYSPPPSSGSVVAASFHPFSHSKTAPMPFCTVAPAPSPSESGQEMRSSLLAASRPARQRTPRLAACVAAADRRVRARRSCRNQAGLVFRPPGIYTFFPGTALKRSRNRFPTR
jgi:hypothetical protein